jgi:mono/diheme cytochrome c family protein
MKVKMSKTLIAMMVLIGLVVFSSFRQAKKPWAVPDKYNKMTSPVKPDDASVKEGKALWTKHCQSCHGKTGLGDGPKAAQLKTEPGDLSKADFQKQSDGSLFYKVSEGRDDMPSFKKKMADEEEIWQVITYVRTFKK